MGDGGAAGRVIVVANEKGGTGKSTIAVNIALGLMKAGHTVAALDLDRRQGTLSRYLENRRNWAEAIGRALESPTLSAALDLEYLSEQDRGAACDALVARVADLSRTHQFVVIDTPGHNNWLMATVHAVADTLITPLNDSLLDLDVLGIVDADTLAVEQVAHYAQLVEMARLRRQQLIKSDTDWIVLRNRLSSLNSRNKRFVGEALQQLSARLQFRVAEGIAERLIFRELFLRGLTALDDLDAHVLGTRPTMSHVTSRLEIEALLTAIASEQGKPVTSGNRDAA